MKKIEKVSPNRPTVLAVNDAPEVLELLTLLLEREGYRVVSAEDGRSALEMARTIAPDIVISDVVMPLMDGLEFCRQLKQDARTRDVPVLLVSAVRTADEDNLRGLIAGADDYLEMPFRRQELLVKVARLTERHRVERHYREIVEQAVDIIYTRDMQGNLTSINAAGARFFGRPASDLIGAPLGDLLGPEAAAADIAETRKISSDEPLRSVHHLKDAQGVPHYLEGMITVVRGARGRATGVRGVVRDVTERKLAEEALKESEERYRSLVEFSPDMVAVHHEGKIVYINAAGVELLGAASPEELIGTPVLDIVHPDYLETVRARIRQLQEAGQRTELLEEKFVRLDGQVIDVEVTGIPTVYVGKPAVQVVVRDITKRKRAESERQVIFEILQGVMLTANVDELLKLIHQSVSKVLHAENCFVALYEPASEMIHFKFFIDKFDPPPPPRNLSAKTLTAYVLRTGLPLLVSDVNDELFRELKARGEVELSGTDAPSWLGVPLRTPAKTIGVLVVQHYEEKGVYSGRDVEFLLSVGGQIALAIERKRGEEALKESEEKFRLIVETTSEWIWSINLEGRHTYNNPTVETILGYAPEELLGKDTLRYLHEDDRPKVEEMLPQMAAEKRGWTGLVLRWRHKDGTYRYLESHGIPIFDGGGEVVGFRGADRDITARKRAEEASLENQERFRSAFDNAPIGMALVSLDGRWLQVNHSLCEIVGYTEQELLATDFQTLTHPDDLAADLDYVRQVVEGSIRSYQMEKRYFHRDGHVVCVLLSVSLMRDASGEPRYFISQIEDITERKKAGEALAQQAKREALINRISSAVHRSLDPTEVFRTAVGELGSHLGVDRCILFMQDRGAGVVQPVAEYRAAGVPSASRTYDLSKIGDLISGIRQYGVLSFDDAATDERIRHVYNNVLRAVGVRSIMYVGVKVGDEIPGTFALSTTRGVRHWHESDIALARAVADQTGIAIRQAELYQKAAATSAREALINRLSLAIRASLSLSEVLRTATHELGRALSASRVHLHLYDPARPSSPAEHEYVAPNALSIKHLDVSFTDPIGQRLLRVSQPVVIDDALNYMDGSAEFSSAIRSHAALTRLRSQIACPLNVNGRFRGALCIHQTDRVRRWKEDDVALVEAVAAQLATGIAQAELFEITRRAKKEWETTFDAMSDGIFIFDNAGQLIRVNRAGASMEDTWPHLLLGRHCCDILRTSVDEACIVEKAIDESQSVTMEITPERYNRPLLVTVEPVIESGNKTVGAVCTARDLSDLRKMEAVARERQSLLTNILESVREPICAIDTKGSFLWCNSATSTAGGYQPEDLIGHHFMEIVYGADREMARDYFESALSGETQSYEARYLARDGEVRYALFDNAPLVMEGRTTGVLCIWRDVTEQKQQRQRAAQADKLRALGQLASGVAHDFNNALAAILGRAQLMRRDVQTESVTRNLEIIQTAAEDAAATVRRIQTFARQSQLKEFELLDVSSLLRDAVEITRTRWENEALMRGLRYDVTLEAAHPFHTSGSASELREVFVNLIVNAVDAMPYGGRLTISCERKDARLLLRFKDTGTGMTEDVREKIFEPFYTTKGAHGTGLGLAVSYGIIERHEGSISVESEVGKGTTFEIDLPVAEATDERADERREETETPSLSILVVDDESFVRETLGDMLEALSHRVATAGSGREAIEILDSDHFDLVFTDLSMPEMDGWEVAREIRRRWPEMSIVLVTGYGKGTAPPTGEKNLINGVIGKPFDFAQVSETIAKIRT
ncbi:MAG: PAS domain S-box protein [Pyrinomonadaceae bacterium]